MKKLAMERPVQTVEHAAPLHAFLPYTISNKRFQTKGILL